MSIMEIFFGKKAPEIEGLVAQVEKLDAVHELLEKSSREIDAVKATLVAKANGSLYPYLSKAGDKISG